MGLTIGGSSVSFRNPQLTETLNGRDHFSCEVISLDGTYVPADHAAVVWTEGAVLFGGVVESPSRAGLGGYGVTPTVVSIDCVSHDIYADWRKAEITLAAGTLKSMLQSIVPLLSGYGVALHASQVDGPTLTDDILHPLGPLSALLDKLSVITGYAWRIDSDKKLRMFAPGTESAPFAVTVVSEDAIGDITVRASLVDYANRIVVRFAAAERRARAYLIASAVVDGDEVYVGGPGWAGQRTYIFKSTLSDVDGYVQVGGSVTASLANLAAAINRTGTPGTQYATSTGVNEFISATMRDDGSLMAEALESGDAGNGVLVAESAPGDLMVWTQDGGAETGSLQLGTDEPAASVAIAEDIAEQDGGARLIERVIDRSDIIDHATALAFATGELARSLVVPKEMVYETLESGITPGMQQTNVIAPRDIDGACLVTEVRTYAVGTVLRRAVTAVEGLVIPPTLRESWSGVIGVASAPGLSTTSGGSVTTTVLSSPVPLGGSDAQPVPMPGPAYTAVPFALRYTARASFTGLVRVWLWARDAGVTVTARLYDRTAAAAVGTSTAVTATSRPSSADVYYAAITSGHEYELQIVSGTAGKSAYGMGTLEAA